jgi:hypothetical protein
MKGGAEMDHMVVQSTRPCPSRETSRNWQSGLEGSPQAMDS